MSVVLELEELKINIVNTHLIRWPRERLARFIALLNKPGFPSDHNPIIYAGDFTGMLSGYRKACERFKNIQGARL